MVAPFEIRCAEVRLSPSKTTPGRLRETAVATPPSPLTKGKFLHSFRGYLLNSLLFCSR